MPFQTSDTLTPREYELYNQQKEMFELQAAHELRVKTMEAKFSSWLKLPLFIIMLPVRMIMAVAFCIAVARKTELGPNFWNFMK